jgi:hypothetical protein
MLLVISIITLLIALLLPSLGRSRREAHGSHCLANLHQLHGAQVTYCADNAGRTKWLAHSNYSYWHHSLAAYLGDPTYKLNPDLGQWKTTMKVLTCPLAVREPVAAFGSADIVWNWGGGGQGSYGANLWLFPHYVEYDNDFRFPDTSFYSRLIHADATTPLYGDSNWIGSWPLEDDHVPQSLYWGSPAIHEIGFFMGRFVVDRHDRSVQLVFADGGAQRVRLGDLWQLQWSRGFQPRQVLIP